MEIYHPGCCHGIVHIFLFYFLFFLKVFLDGMINSLKKERKNPMPFPLTSNIRIIDPWVSTSSLLPNSTWAENALNNDEL